MFPVNSASLARGIGLMLLVTVLILSSRAYAQEDDPLPQDFRGADLTGADYVLADLRDADLSGSTLTNADLAVADLRNATLVDATLIDARLEAANLRGADLSNADIRHADLSLADLRDAILRNADLSGAIFHTADLRRANLRNADLSDSDLSNANLTGADLTGVRLVGATFDAHTVWPAGFDPESARGDATEEAEAPTLRLEMSLSPPMVPLFNAAAHSSDIARVDHPRDIGLLDDVTTGNRMAVFKSAALAAQLAPRLTDHVDIIGYNLEQGSLNPVDEQADPVAAAIRLRQVVDEHGLRLAIGPDRDFALSHGAALAPLADQFVLQIQRAQTEPNVAIEFVRAMAATLRSANPNIEISVQLRTEGDPDQLITLIDTLRPDIDGVALLTSPDAVDMTADMLARLRGVAPAVQRVTPTLTEPASSRAASEPPRWRALFIGLGLETALILALIGGVILIAAVVNRRHRQS